MTIDPRLHRIVAAQPYPLLFATISGAHLYGFPSPDSDFDLRGAHLLPVEKIVGLEVSDETICCYVSGNARFGMDGKRHNAIAVAPLRQRDQYRVRKVLQRAKLLT